ncbi:MAG: hypothetical protein ACFFED_03285 [Candidatus Thorarchaeota archaeon]
MSSPIPSAPSLMGKLKPEQVAYLLIICTFFLPFLIGFGYGKVFFIFPLFELSGFSVTEFPLEFAFVTPVSIFVWMPNLFFSYSVYIYYRSEFSRNILFVVLVLSLLYLFFLAFLFGLGVVDFYPLPLLQMIGILFYINPQKHPTFDIWGNQEEENRW